MEERLRLWSELGDHEDAAWKTNGEWLAVIESAIAVLHDSPNALTTLPGYAAGQERTNVAGMCLKRALDELRAMWLLLNAGYTASTGAACADLWEHAMLASCCSLSEDVARQFLNLGPDDPKFGPSKLSALLAKLIAEGLGDARPTSTETVQYWDAASYSAYKWLCQLKHPTLRALQHTTLTTVSNEGVLGLSARPDASEADRSVKALILITAFGVIQKAVILFGSAVVGDQNSEKLRAWQTRLAEAQQAVEAQLPPDSLNPPWSIGDTRAGRRLRELSPAPLENPK